MLDKGTRNAVFVLKTLAERCIDFTKTFDRIQHNILFELLSDLEVQDRDLRLVQNLYIKQKANICLKDQLSNFVQIARRVRQGCVMSPNLFLLYSGVILRSIDKLEGVKIGGVNINDRCRESAIGQHLIANPECAKTYTDDNFRIIGQARSSFHLSVLESVYIKTQNPILCRQKEFVFSLGLFK